jgi:hypothetical protein
MLLAASFARSILFAYLSFTEDYLEMYLYLHSIYESFVSNSGKMVNQFPADINGFTISQSVQIGLRLPHSHVLWLWGCIYRDKLVRA